MKAKKFHTSAHQIVETELKKNAETDSDDLIIVGKASTAHVDRANHVVDFDTMRKVAPKFLGALLWQHNKDAPIGKVLENWFEKGVDADEWWIRAAVGNGWSVPQQKFGAAKLHLSEIREMIRHGAARTLSIGFGADPQRPENEGDPVVLHVKDVYEVSVVTLPANTNATFDVAASMEDEHEVAFDVQVDGGHVVASVVVDGVTYTSRHALDIEPKPDRAKQVEEDFDEAERRVLNECVQTIRSARNELSGAGEEADAALAAVLQDVKGIRECQRQQN